MKTRFKLNFLMMVLFSVCSLASCADMGGDFNNDTEYGKGYSVNFIKADKSKAYTEDVSITDFYNKDSVNEFACPLDYDEYRYLIIKPTDDQEIDSIYFYVNSQTETRLSCKLYVVTSLPTKYVDLDNALSSFETFLSGTETTFNYDYGDEPVDNDVSSTVKSLSANKWTDVGFTSFYSGENKIRYADVSSSNYLLVQFYNNGDTGVTFDNTMDINQATQQIINRRANKASIKITNIMIHSKNK